MAQFGKASSKRGKANYIYSIIGVAVVLFLFGLMGWLFLGIRKSGELAKEKLEVHAFINRIAFPKQVDSLKNYISSSSYVNNVKFTSKEAAAEKYTEMEQDTGWKKYLEGYNPFEASIDFTLKSNYINKDSVRVIDSTLRQNYGHILTEVTTDLDTVKNLTTTANWILGVLIALVIILGIIVIISIDNTIRLAMYSNRFLMKTMQMVGATRNFIVKPLLIRALINGLVAAGVAVLAVMGFIWLAEKFLPQLTLIRDNKNMIYLFIVMTLVGAAICIVSTYRSSVKYLRMKLDDLY